MMTCVPGDLDLATARALVEVSADGLAVLDADGCVHELNPAAREILGEIVGHPAPFTDPGGTVTWRRRVLEYRARALPDGRRAVWFGDVTAGRVREERLTAIAAAAATVADTGSLRATLEAVAREVAATAGLAAVQILAIEEADEDLRVLGMAGFGRADDFVARLRACRERGADIRFFGVLSRGETVVVPHRKPVIMADPAWEPLHEIMGRPDWDGFVGMPLAVRGRTVGVLNAYYAPGEDPGPDALAFLGAMAAHAALAVDIARLIVRAQLDERRRVARDLHDSVVQLLFSLRMQATALRSQLARGDDVTTTAEDLIDLAGGALGDLRRVVAELRPAALADSELGEAVRAHAAGVAARTGLEVDVQVVDGAEDPPAALAEDVVRIVAEALHNVVKHARATTASVRLESDATGTVLEVGDDGVGGVPPVGPNDRLGLVSMRERAERWGGHLEAGPGPDGGWIVRAALAAPR